MDTLNSKPDDSAGPLKVTALNSDLAIPKERRSFLTFPTVGLADCSLEEHEDCVCLCFDTTGLEPASGVFSKPTDQKLRFLINCADLSGLHEEYVFSMSAENLLVDINLKPLILMRDANCGYSGGNSFLPKLKALIGSFLLNKDALLDRYVYEDFEEGGGDLYKKDKLMLELSKMESVAEIKGRLLEEYQATLDDIAGTLRMVRRGNMVAARIAIPVLVAALVAVAFFGGLAYFYDIPYKTRVAESYEAYIAGDHLAVQRALSGFPVHRLSHETKHVLSRSYVFTEPISMSQRETLLAGLTLITDTVIFDYWIHIGRLEFNYAVDIAQRFGENELLMFAYIKQEAIVRADPNMPGAEKLEALSYLERQMNELQRIREDAAAATAAAAVADEPGEGEDGEGEPGDGEVGEGDGEVGDGDDGEGEPDADDDGTDEDSGDGPGASELVTDEDGGGYIGTTGNYGDEGPGPDYGEAPDANISDERFAFDEDYATD